MVCLQEHRLSQGECEKLTYVLRKRGWQLFAGSLDSEYGYGEAILVHRRYAAVSLTPVGHCPVVGLARKNGSMIRARCAYRPSGDSHARQAARALSADHWAQWSCEPGAGPCP